MVICVILKSRTGYQNPLLYMRSPIPLLKISQGHRPCLHKSPTNNHSSNSLPPMLAQFNSFFLQEAFQKDPVRAVLSFIHSMHLSEPFLQTLIHLWYCESETTMKIIYYNSNITLARLFLSLCSHLGSSLHIPEAAVGHLHRMHGALPFLLKPSRSVTVPMLSCFLGKHLDWTQSTAVPLCYRDRKLSLKEKAAHKGYRIGFWVRTQVFQFFGCQFLWGVIFSTSPHCQLNLNSWLQNDLLVLFNRLCFLLDSNPSIILEKK